jgi:STE24 endopeptidase
VIGSLLLMLLYGVLRRAPRTWWLWGALVTIGFVIVGAAVAPVFIAPIFNKFTPVHDEAIRRDILAMARQQTPAASPTRRPRPS